MNWAETLWKQLSRQEKLFPVFWKLLCGYRNPSLNCFWAPMNPVLTMWSQHMQVLTYRCVSTAVYKRFPTLQHVVAAGELCLTRDWRYNPIYYIISSSAWNDQCFVCIDCRAFQCKRWSTWINTKLPMEFGRTRFLGVQYFVRKKQCALSIEAEMLILKRTLRETSFFGLSHFFY